MRGSKTNIIACISGSKSNVPYMDMSRLVAVCVELPAISDNALSALLPAVNSVLHPTWVVLLWHFRYVLFYHRSSSTTFYFFFLFFFSIHNSFFFYFFKKLYISSFVFGCIISFFYIRFFLFYISFYNTFRLMINDFFVFLFLDFLDFFLLFLLLDFRNLIIILLFDYKIVSN